MAGNWQLLLLAGALLPSAGVWAEENDGKKQQQEKWARERVWDDGQGQYNRGVVSAMAGFTRVWEDVVYGVHGRGYVQEAESEKAWRKEQKKRDREDREARRQKRGSTDTRNQRHSR